MLYKYFYQYFVILAIATFSQTSIFFFFLAGVNAQKIKQIPEPNSINPQSTIGGAGRNCDGKCLFVSPTVDPAPTITLRPAKRNGDRIVNQSLEQSLATLLPTNKFGLTVLSNPSFFVYVPKTSLLAVEFVLENQQGLSLDRQMVNLKITPTIISFQLPTTKSLEVGKDYKWTIFLVNKSGQTEDDRSEGIIRRVIPDPTLSEKLQTASDIDRVFLFAYYGIWHEALASIVQLRLAQPNNEELNPIWLDLLKSSNLESLANTPFQN